MPSETITSLQNPKVKQLIALQEKSRERRALGLFVVEGRRELQHCLEAGYEVDTIFLCEELAGPLQERQRPLRGRSEDRGVSLNGTLQERQRPLRGRSEDRGVSLNGTLQGRVFEVSREVYEKVAYRESAEGVIAEVKVRERKLEELELRDNPVVVVLESVEKPGNLGAVLRTADAAGVDAVLVCDPLTDLYNPNLIRASLGGIFTVPCVACTSEDAIAFLKGKGIQILTAQLQDSEWYYDRDMTRGTAIVIGTEATGLTDIWREAADAHIKIPMLGKLDSLNASVSAAILIYEAVRQRNA